jgi:mRNA interferase RelE/StbE
MWKVEYLKAAVADLKKLDRSQRIEVFNKINRTAENPLPKSEGGYGEPLANTNVAQLAGYCKIKLLKLGIRVVYRLEKSEDKMKIIVVSARTDEEVYKIAQVRKQNKDSKL